MQLQSQASTTEQSRYFHFSEPSGSRLQSTTSTNNAEHQLYNASEADTGKPNYWEGWWKITYTDEAR